MSYWCYQLKTEDGALGSLIIPLGPGVLSVLTTTVMLILNANRLRRKTTKFKRVTLALKNKITKPFIVYHCLALISHRSTYLSVLQLCQSEKGLYLQVSCLESSTT